MPQPQSYQRKKKNACVVGRNMAKPTCLPKGKDITLMEQTMEAAMM
jgi:hypothetical protein